MSNTPALPTQDQAMLKIAQEWEAPIFFRRLEQKGIVPGSDAEACELLKLSMVLEQKEAQQKQAAAQSLSGLVRKALKRAGVDPVEEEINELSKQSAAQGLALDPELLKAFAVFA